MKNYYTILEVPVGSEIAEIRESYRRLVQKHMLDKDAFAELMEAYEVLSSPSRRREYDKRTFEETETAPQAPMDTPSVNNPSNILLFEASRSCPMSKGEQCPIANAAVPVTETFCPECGFQLADLPEDGFDPAALVAATDFTHLYCLEEETGRQHRLSPGSNAVGRETGAVILPDKTVSRDHADIHIKPEGTVFVEDKGSTNGTQINGERLAAHFPREIRDGDTVRFGSIRLLLRTPGEETEGADGADRQILSGMSLVPGVVTDFVPESERESAFVADMGLVPGLGMGFGLGGELPQPNDPRNNSGMFITGPAGILTEVPGGRVTDDAEGIEGEDDEPIAAPDTSWLHPSTAEPLAADFAQPAKESDEFSTASGGNLPTPSDIHVGAAMTGLGASGPGQAGESTGEILSIEPARARLVTSGDGVPETYALRSDITTFGRRAENTFIIRDDAYVSGRHVMITANEGIFTLTDLGSTNGTLFNGERMVPDKPVVLSTGDIVTIGGRALRFEVEGAADDDAAPSEAMTNDDPTD